MSLLNQFNPLSINKYVCGTLGAMLLAVSLYAGVEHHRVGSLRSENKELSDDLVRQKQAVADRDAAIEQGNKAVDELTKSRAEAQAKSEKAIAEAAALRKAKSKVSTDILIEKPREGANVCDEAGTLFDKYISGVSE